ncbi:MAG: hypothetical protein ACTHOI_04420 [Sphingomicrobium sp.]
MATTVPVYEDRQVSIGRVFQRAFSAISLNPVVVLGLALVVGAVPGLIMTYLFVQLGLTSTATLQSGAFSFREMMAATLLSSLIMMVIATLVQGALTRAVVSANEGRKATFGESLSTGLRVLLPLIALGILFAIGVGIGFILLVVPGIILLLMWAVATPALVVERTGVFGAFSRSSELTKGARWKILGLFIVLVVIYWLMSIVLGVVGLKMYSAGTSAGGLSAGNLIGSVVLGTIFNVLWGTIQPSLYVELRQAKEGGSLENLEEVFA